MSAPDPPPRRMKTASVINDTVSIFIRPRLNDIRSLHHEITTRFKINCPAADQRTPEERRLGKKLNRNTKSTVNQLKLTLLRPMTITL